jgi:hypothetical protein
MRFPTNNPLAINIYSAILPGMGWADALKHSLGIYDKSASSSSFSPPPARKVNHRDLGFTNNALSKMSQWNLSEADIKDVFFHGGVIVKPQMIVKKYNGYEIGLYYFQDKETGRFVISSVWKRGRY